MSGCNNGLPNCITPLPMDASGKMSDYEFLCWVSANMKTLFAQFGNLEQAFNELKAYVDNFINELDIESIVSQQLQEMYDNGQITALLKQLIIQPGLQPFCDTMFYAQAIIDDYIGTNLSSVGIQGMAIGNYQGANIMCIGATDGKLKANAGFLITYNMTTGAVLSYKTDLNIGHANGITFCNKDNYFYIACGGGSNGINKVSVYDTSLNFIRDISFATMEVQNPYGIAYDSIRDEFYVVCSNGILASLDYNFNVVRTGTIKINEQYYVAQSIFTDGKFVFFITGGSATYTYNKFDLYDCDTLEYYNSQYVLMHGELESCCFLNGKLYLCENISNSGLIYEGNVYGDGNTYQFIPDNIFGRNYIQLSATLSQFYYTPGYTGFLIKNTSTAGFNRFYALTNCIYFAHTDIVAIYLYGDVEHNINIKNFPKRLNIYGYNGAKVSGIALRAMANVVINGVTIVSRNDVNNSCLYLYAVNTCYLENVVFQSPTAVTDVVSCSGVNLITVSCTYNTQCTRHLLHMLEGSTHKSGGASTYTIPGVIYFDDPIGNYYQISPSAFSVDIAGGIRVISSTSQPAFNIWEVKMQGRYRVESGVQVNGIPQWVTAPFYFTVDNGYDHEIVYTIYDYTELLWQGIADIESDGNGTITWEMLRHMSYQANITNEYVTGYAFCISPNFKQWNIIGRLTINGTINKGDTLIIFNTNAPVEVSTSYGFINMDDGTTIPFSIDNKEVKSLTTVTVENKSGTISCCYVAETISFTITP